MSAWNPEKATERAQTAYRYVAEVYPRGAGYAPLDAHTAAAWEAERVGDWPAFEEALRDMMRAARRESRRAA